jgi:hypothetical protein
MPSNSPGRAKPKSKRTPKLILWPQRASVYRIEDRPPMRCPGDGTGTGSTDGSQHRTCKEWGDGNCCERCNNPVLEIQPGPATIKVGIPAAIVFRVYNLGMGDLVIYTFGRVDWGDSQQDWPIVNGAYVPLVHTYTTAGVWTIKAIAGAQFKYEWRHKGERRSCSYECCVDTAQQVEVVP